jgi:hypothetical protein
MADQIQIVDQPTAKDISKDNVFLFKFKAIFPLDLFPDEVILDKLKISIIKRDFFFSKRIITLPLTTTINVKIFRGPITSQIEIDDTSTLHQNPIPIRNIFIHDAIRFQELVEGIVIGMRQGINLMRMDKDELIDTASKWGAVKAESL